MTGKNDDEATKETIKKIVEEGKWPVFVGSSTNKREDCAQYTHKKSMILKGYGETEKGCGEIEIIDLAGQTGKEILKSVLGQNLESNLNKFKKKLWEYREINEEAEWKLLEAGTGAVSVSQDDYARIEAIRRVRELVKESPILNLCCQFKTLFINNLQCKNENDINAVKKLFAFIRQNIKDFQGMLVVGICTVEDYKKSHHEFPNQLEEIPLGKLNTVISQAEIKAARLKRGEKQEYVPHRELIPFIKQSMEYFKSDKGGALKGGALAGKLKKDIYKKFEETYGKKAVYEETTIGNLISEINTGKK